MIQNTKIQYFTSVPEIFALMRASATFTKDGSNKKAVFAVPQPEFALLRNKFTDEEIENYLTQTIEDITDDKDIDGVFYFWYTGSHFVIQTEEPKWA